jgi:hypothetical protein
MRHPDPRPAIPVALTCSDRGGSPWPGPRLRGLVARLLEAAWPRRGGQATAIQAGYALRRRQEANLQRLACPACRPPRPAGADGDSAGITPLDTDRHGTEPGVTYGLALEAGLPPGPERPPSVVAAVVHEPLERTHGTP